MWQSEADIINDLAILNDFGEPGSTEPYKVLCSVGRGSNAKKKPHSQTALDPRTGEEVDVGNHCLSLEDMFCRGKGRGASLGSRSYSLLQKQLRLARPLGSGDDIIESYCRRNKKADQIEDSGVLPMSELNINDSKTCDTSCSTNATIPNKMGFRVKAVRSSNLLNNALMSGLLKAKEFSDTEKSKQAEKFEKTSQIYPSVCSNIDVVKSAVSQNDSNSDDSSSWTTNEDNTSGSLYNSENNYKDKLSKIKSGYKSSESYGIQSGADLSDLNFRTRINKVKLKHATRNTNDSYCANINKTPNRNEMYRRLGEKLNRMTVFDDKRRKNEISFSLKKQGSGNNSSGFQHVSHVDPVTKQFVNDEFNFPPLLKNS